MLQLLSDESLYFELLRILAYSRYGGSDVGEVLAAVSQITPGDIESYYKAFDDLARRIEARTEKMTTAVSKRDALFRASTYYFAADFYIHGDQNDPRIMELWKKHTDTFDRAMALLPNPGYRITLKTEHGFDIPVLFFVAGAKGDNTPRATAMLLNGFDGSMEESYFQYGIAALERGYNVCCFEGPGQCEVIRYQGKGFIKEYECVVTPVVDYLSTLPNVKKNQIVLLGNSMSAFLAARAASFEHRLAGCIQVDGI